MTLTLLRPGALRMLALSAVVAFGLASGPAAAAYPERPLKIVVPFTPGGGTDVVSRMLARVLGQELGQTVLVENKPGGSTIIGSDAVAKSPPDGYTMLMATFAHAVNPAIHPNLPYDTSRDFAPVALIGKSPNVLVVSTKSRFNSVQDILDYARTNPGQLTFGSYGSGTSAHLSGELFKTLGKLDILHIPYKGAGPGINDLMGGQIDMIFSTSASVAGHIKNGSLRPIAVTTKERSPAYPGIPTVAESGLPDYFVDSWYGVFVRSGTPDDVIQTLYQAIQKAAADPDYQRALNYEGLSGEVASPQVLGDYVESEQARWRKIAQEAGIKAD